MRMALPKLVAKLIQGILERCRRTPKCPTSMYMILCFENVLPALTQRSRKALHCGTSREALPPGKTPGAKNLSLARQ